MISIFELNCGECGACTLNPKPATKTIHRGYAEKAKTIRIPVIGDRGAYARTLFGREIFIFGLT